jgi:DNA polymerase I-like protein with 3'-5' exonuclease and polymerase domains
LVAQIHDELLFEVDAVGSVLAADGSVQTLGDKQLRVAGSVKRIMEGAVALRVPLRVNITIGMRWGGMAPVCLP